MTSAPAAPTELPPESSTNSAGTSLGAWLPANSRLIVFALCGLAVLAGVGSLMAGALRATVWAPAASTTTHVGAPASAPVIVVAPEMLAASGSSLTVQVTGGSATAPVFVGVARTGDAEAYLGSAARAVVTGVDGEGASATAQVSARDGEATLPDPAGVDVWADLASADGTASLEWPTAPGSWELVVAADGRGPAPAVDLAWRVAPRSSGAPALFAVGAVLLIVGALGLLLWSRAARRPSVQTVEPAAGDDDVPVRPFRHRRDEGTA